jgi:AraC-like DNA-binding protein
MNDFAFLHSNHDPHCIARVDKHFDGYFTLQFMARGGVELSYDQTQHQLEGRWFWTAYPGPHIRFHAAPGHEFWEHRYVAFQGARVRRWQNMGLWLTGPQAAPQGMNWDTRFDELLHCARCVEKLATLRGANLLEGILLDLTAARLEPASEFKREPWLENVLEELNREGAFSPEYAKIASRCGMGLSTLRRRFREATGTAIHNYVLQNRMARARQLLGESNLPLKAIAAELGYGDVYFFAAQFRRLTGVTPSAYRKSRQA